MLESLFNKIFVEHLPMTAFYFYNKNYKSIVYPHLSKRLCKLIHVSYDYDKVYC